jgi:hypothetical protein
LTEVDVPPGAAVAEKLAAFFPGMTDTVLAIGNRLWERVSSRRPKAEQSGKPLNGGLRSDG